MASNKLFQRVLDPEELREKFMSDHQEALKKYTI